MAEIALRRREQVAEGTLAFYFDKPAGFSHEAGQNAMFTLIEPPQEDAAGPTRTFTIASAPHEPDLMIATRMRDSAFKRFLAKAQPGAKLEMEGPLGLMVLHEDASRPAVFLAGGIGITPFLAMVRDAAKRELPHQLVLLYSNRRLQDAAFLAELERLRGPRFRMVATMTDAPQWRGEKLARDTPLLTAPLGCIRHGRHHPEAWTPQPLEFGKKRRVLRPAIGI